MKLNRISRRSRLVIAAALCIGVVLTGLASRAWAGGLGLAVESGRAQPEQLGPTGAGSDPAGAVLGGMSGPSTVFLPLVADKSSFIELSYRLGVGVSVHPLGGYPEFPSMRVGWYQDWWSYLNPPRPNGMEYAPTIRVHQELVCPLWSENAADREECPYKRPYDYVTDPSMDMVLRSVRASPGSLWIIGNEMDRRDWAIPGGALGQDEMLPETYATAYHDIYHAIKAADPTAKVAIGGVIQATPLRLQYLSQIWDHYKNQYGTEMPVDVWNVHNFILQEKLWDYGAGIPPGIDAETGVVYGSDSSHIDMTLFDNQIRAFRQWMKDRGQQSKPLIVSEYGVLYPDGTRGIDFGPAVVQDFMIKTFDYFLHTKDCDLGMVSDDCRLVQRWAWFCLAGVGPEWGINNHVALFDANTRQITATGIKYREWSLLHLRELAAKY